MKILIIGLGSIAKKHIAAIKSIDSKVKIYALRSSINTAQYQNVRNIFSIEEVSNLLLDFCIISSPTYKHSDDILKLSHLKIPLFIEKPLFNSLINKELIVNKITHLKIKTYIACNLRFLDCLNFIKNEIKTNKSIINEVSAYCGSYLPDWRPNNDYKQSYSANTEMGGGVHLDLIHELDYCFWLFGKPTSVTKKLKSKSTLDINSVDYANYLLEYDNFMASIVLNYYRRDPKRQLEIVFEDYTITVDLLKNTVYKNKELIYKSDQKMLDTYKTQLQYFIANLETESFNCINEAYEVLKICLK